MRPLVVAGPGRSGTTWLAELLGRLAPARLVFEPLHRRVVRGRMHALRYLRPDTRDPRLKLFWTRVFADAVPGRWVRHLDAGHAAPDYLLAKPIRANLMLGWLRARFPAVPVVYITRHPCAVVASRIRRGWPAQAPFRLAYRQPQLRCDHLAGVTAFCNRLRGELDYHAALWAIETRVALSDAERWGILVVRYEDLVEHRNAELHRVAGHLGVPFRPLADEVWGRPSQVAEWADDGRDAASAPDAWRGQLTEAETARVLDIADAFGLGAARAVAA